MHISSFRVRNYKSFLDSGEIALATGFNVIVGKNNAGKTALLEALSLQYGDIRHRSLTTAPTRTSPLVKSSEVDVLFEVAREELVAILSEQQSHYLPYETLSGQLESDISTQYERELNTIGGTRTASGLWTRRQWNGVVRTVDPNQGVGARRLIWKQDERRLTYMDGANTNLNEGSLLTSVVPTILQSRIYAFRAERLNIGESPVSTTTELARDGSNLAQVLNYMLSANRARWHRYIEYVRVVFPEIQDITVPASGNNSNVHVLIWPVDPVTERDDLAVPLRASGTGIGQVLAMLYVVINAELPRIIIIDEPQSFLHPGAVRTLFEILHRYKQHQYIISTHSAGAISAARPNALVLVRNVNGASTIEQLNPRETQHQRAALGAIGARLSDVFGADEVLWVEGPTEEACFPVIMASLDTLPIKAVVVLAVRQTGDIEARPREVFEIYQSLTQGPQLMPTAIGFVFDREMRTSQERADLARQSRHLVRFTNRRMYENYLLRPKALAAVLSPLLHRDAQAVENDVAAWLATHKWDREFFKRLPKESHRTDEVWLTEVHGARILETLFKSLSSQTVRYDKVSHGLALTQWLCDNEPGQLKEIADILAELITNSGD